MNETDRFNRQLEAFTTLAEKFIDWHYDGRPNYEAAADYAYDTVEIIGLDQPRALALRSWYMESVG